MSCNELGTWHASCSTEICRAEAPDSLARFSQYSLVQRDGNGAYTRGLAWPPHTLTEGNEYGARNRVHWLQYGPAHGEARANDQGAACKESQACSTAEPRSQDRLCGDQAGW